MKTRRKAGRSTPRPSTSHPAPPKELCSQLERIFAVGLLLVFVVVIWTYRVVTTLGLEESLHGLPISEQYQNPDKDQNPTSLAQIQPKQAFRGKSPTTESSGGYDHWLAIAQNLASLPPSQTLAQLEQNDPFGVRTFDAQLLQMETSLGRVLARDELQALFPCPPPDQRATLPDFRNETKAREFRDGKRGTFLFFQHLRKAGGTNFCSLAEKNLPRKAQPHYYCMPDMGWSGNKNAGYLHSWSNEEITSRMLSSGFRIAGNEWENFDISRHFDLPAIFATSFRKPLDRALSQFRFECIEDRGCIIKDVHKWWEKRTDLWNVYTKTFADPTNRVRQYFRGSFSKQRQDLITTAISTVSKFHIVLAMEWLAYAAPQVRSILGFDDVTALTTRVRPHISQANRNDGQEKNALGSASIKKASWDPKEFLDKEWYDRMSEDLALDEVLTDVARRMFLERLVCDMNGSG